jgi:uncharacterized heparinase superfamily protein
VICDAGPIGPDYIPGHAHADMFSFELSLEGHRVIVDSGVYDYQSGELRRYCRSTRAHNTVEIEVQDQCELWGVFRVARRGYPHDIGWQPTETGFRLTGWLDGYQRLAGRPRHQREFVWHSTGRLEIHDSITAFAPVSAVSRLHLHPDCRIDKIEDAEAVISFPAGRFAVHRQEGGPLSVEKGSYCPEFGTNLPQQVLACSQHGSKFDIRFEIELL